MIFIQVYTYIECYIILYQLLFIVIDTVTLTLRAVPLWKATGATGGSSTECSQTYHELAEYE